MESAITASDEMNFRRCAHELAGSCFVLSLDEIAEVAQALKRLDPLDWREAQGLLNKLNGSVEQVRQAVTLITETT